MRFLPVALCLLVPTQCPGQEWTRFRGPNGSGVSDATTVPTKWTDDDYNWQVDLPGMGHSSPVLWGEKLFVTCGDVKSGKRFLVCLNAADGGQRWSRDFAVKEYRKHKLNSLASATPAVDADHVYVCWGSPDEFLVIALDHAGNEVWRREFEGFKSGHGDGVSPIVHDALLVVALQHNGDSAYVALDCKSGKDRWRFDLESKGNWSTPCVFHRNAKTAELIFTNWTVGITALDAKTGRVSWQANEFEKGHVESSISSPIVAGDLVLGTSGWLGVRKEVIAVRPDKMADKDIKVQRVYCLDRGAPLCVTPLVKDDLLFLWSDEGIVTCADVGSGKVHWRKRLDGSFYSSPICVGAAVYNISTDGEVIVLKAAAEFNEIARNKLPEPSHSTPAVADGVMYLRTFSRIISLGGQTD